MFDSAKRGFVIVTIFDYGAGNLHSLAKALVDDNVTIRTEVDPKVAIDTDVLILPGVGAFSAAAERLAPGINEMRKALKNGLPCLGICLGMQLLLDSSEEGPGNGLGVIAGRVRKLRAKQIPQIGWNTIDSDESLPTIAYFANSYVCDPLDTSSIISWTEHESDRFPSAIQSGNTVGVQFHPEKSSKSGVQFIKDFLKNASNTSR